MNDRTVRVLVVLGLVAVAVATRAVALGDRLSDAEGYSWLVASAPDLGAFAGRLAAYENTPPLFYLLLRLTLLDHEAWLRVPALLAGVAAVPLVYAIVRPAAGTRAALLGGALVAVAPYHVSYSDYSRAFTLAGAGVLVAVWGAVRFGERRDRRWLVLYAGGATAALYSEYDAALYLVPVAALALVAARGSRRAVALAAGLPFVALVPWLPQAARATDALHVTKEAPAFPGPSLTALRDLATALVLGEHGAGGGALRWVQLLVIGAGIAVAAAFAIRRRGGRELVVAAGALTTTVLGATAAVSAVGGPDLFNQRYLTTLIPVGAALLAVGVAAAGRRWLRGAAWLAVGLTGAAVLVVRSGRELEPDPAPVLRAVRAARPAEIRTNSAVVAYYLRDLPVRLDRPFGLQQPVGPCPSPCLTIDDARTPSGSRAPGDVVLRSGPYVVYRRPPMATTAVSGAGAARRTQPPNRVLACGHAPAHKPRG